MSDDFQLEQEVLPGQKPLVKINKSKMRTIILEKLAARPQWPLTDLVDELSGGKAGASYIYRRLAALNGHDLEIRKAGKTNWVLAMTPGQSPNQPPKRIEVKVKITIAPDGTITIKYPRRGPKPSHSATGTLTFYSSF